MRRKALAKGALRAASLSTKALLPDVAAYGGRVAGFPVLGCLAQLCPPPPRHPPQEFAVLERRWVARILRLPAQGVEAHSHLSLADYGGLRVPSAVEYVGVVEVRATIVTIADRAVRELELREAEEERGTLQNWATEVYHPFGWDTTRCSHTLCARGLGGRAHRRCGRMLASFLSARLATSSGACRTCSCGVSLWIVSRW